MTGAVDEEPTGATIPWRSPTLHVILGTSLMAAMGVSLVSPGLPAIQTALRLTDARAGLVLTAFSMPSIVLAPVMGALVDRYGRRVVLVPCLVAYGVAGGSIVLAESFRLLIGLRFLQGCAASGLVTLSLTLVGDLFDGSRRNAVMGANTAVMTIGVAVFPVVGGFLADVDWNLPFATYAVSVVVGAFAFVTLERSTADRSTLDLTYLRRALDRVTAREGLLLYGAVLVAFVVYIGALNTSVPFLLDQSFALAGLWIGVVLSLPLVVSSLVALASGRLARHLSSRQLIGLGFVGYGLGLTGVGLTDSLVGVATALLLVGAGHGLFIPSADTAISGLASDELRGGVMSLRLSAKKVGQTVGPVLFPSLAALVGYPRLLLATGVATLATGVVAVVIVGRRRR